MAQGNNVVPGTVDPSVDPVSTIPAANLAAAAQTVGGGAAQGNPRDVALLQSIQAQLNQLMGKATGQSQTDLVMVNPGGRIVEISGEMVDEYLGKAGFRKATDEEEANYRKAILRSMPEYLRRREKKRLQEQAALLDSLEEEDDFENVSTDDLQRAPVNPGQLTGAPAARTQPAPAAATTPPSTASDGTGDAATSPDAPTTPKPRSRSRAKAK
jgi:hypothetical protein